MSHHTAHVLEVALFPVAVVCIMVLMALLGRLFGNRALRTTGGPAMAGELGGRDRGAKEQPPAGLEGLEAEPENGRASATGAGANGHRSAAEPCDRGSGPPGWLPDPDGRPDYLRYHDGAAWTDHYARRVRVEAALR